MQLLALSLLLSNVAISAETTRYIEWQGSSGASHYELQASETSKFAPDSTVIQKLKSPHDFFSSSKATLKYFRLRPIYESRPGKWIPLRPAKWAVPLMKERFQVPKSKNDRFEIKWTRPKTSLKGSFRYRVTLTPWQSKDVLFDAFTDSESFLLPPLPGGNYTLTVEPSGIPTLGTVTQKDAIYRSALIEVEALEYDPKNPNPERDVITSYSLHDSSFRPQLSYTQSRSQSILTPRISMQFDSGFTFALDAPLVLWDKSTSSPRLGGTPYSLLTFAYKFIGTPLRHFGWRLDLELPIDSRKKAFFSIDLPFDVNSEFYLLWSWAKTWQMQLNLGGGVHSPALHAPNHRPFQEFAFLGGVLRWKTPYEKLAIHAGLKYEWNAAIDLDQEGFIPPEHKVYWNIGSRFLVFPFWAVDCTVSGFKSAQAALSSIFFF